MFRLESNDLMNLAHLYLKYNLNILSASGCPGHQQEQNPTKQRIEHAATFTAVPANQVYAERTDGAYTGRSTNFTSTTPFLGDNTVSLNSIHNSRISALENNISMPEEESNEQSPSS